VTPHRSDYALPDLPRSSRCSSCRARSAPPARPTSTAPSRAPLPPCELKRHSVRLPMLALKGPRVVRRSPFTTRQMARQAYPFRTTEDRHDAEAQTGLKPCARGTRRSRRPGRPTCGHAPSLRGVETVNGCGSACDRPIKFAVCLDEQALAVYGGPMGGIGASDLALLAEATDERAIRGRAGPGPVASAGDAVLGAIWEGQWV